ncbi:hypothetical protein DUI87_19428 [Hirundo rustica rustica]|uniref:Reverse transcriptase domain-containing protein n=1 Tax=Hirundo rustica rustica TaxID=333673 RepID=A0A3M0JV79_HIRRU|nr:hypothetical protein DUI87_19428 [Hirundo rustica rustica]
MVSEKLWEARHFMEPRVHYDTPEPRRFPVDSTEPHGTKGPIVAQQGLVEPKRPWGMRQLVDELTKLLSIISHQSWLTREVPEDWRCQCEPIPKKGWKEDMGNSRPVSLTSVLSKVLEQITLRAITWHPQDGRGIRPS